MKKNEKNLEDILKKMQSKTVDIVLDTGWDSEEKALLIVKEKNQALSEIQALVPKKEKTVKFISTVRNDTIDEMLENMGLRED